MVYPCLSVKRPSTLALLRRGGGDWQRWFIIYRLELGGQVRYNARMKRLKTIMRIAALLALACSLSGCIAMWIGGGAAGGYYGAKHYKVEKISSS